MNTFPTKHPGETFPISVDFARLTPTVLSATVTVTVRQGTDANPSAMLVGLPQVVGTRVTQMVTGGLNGVMYEITIAATDGTSTWIFERLLPVSNDL